MTAATDATESAWQAEAWTFVKARGEPDCWTRPAGPSELEGFDPLSGQIIAHSHEECARLDAKREVRS